MRNTLKGLKKRMISNVIGHNKNLKKKAESMTYDQLITHVNPADRSYYEKEYEKLNWR